MLLWYDCVWHASKCIELSSWCETVSAPNLAWEQADNIYIAITFFIIPIYTCNKYTLLYELACNIVSYCTSGRGIFTSRRRVKMQPTSAIIAIGMLTSVIKCLLSIPEQRLVSSHTKYQVTRRSNAN